MDDPPWDSGPLIRPERLKELLEPEYPEYCRGMAEADWEAAAERLSALARLIWKWSAEPDAGAEGADKAGEG